MTKGQQSLVVSWGAARSPLISSNDASVLQMYLSSGLLFGEELYWRYCYYFRSTEITEQKLLSQQRRVEALKKMLFDHLLKCWEVGRVWNFLLPHLSFCEFINQLCKTWRQNEANEENPRIKINKKFYYDYECLFLC